MENFYISERKSARVRSELTGDEILRVFLVPIINLAYASYLCWLYSKFDFFKDNYILSVIIAIVWFLIFVAWQSRIVIKSIDNFNKEPYCLTWLNVPMLTYILMILIPYCVALNQVYKQEKPKTEHLIGLQSIMAVLVISNILYPLPIRRTRALATAAIAIGSVNAFDIMDIVSDLQYLQHYGTFFHAWFYIAFAFSLLLMAFPVGLDEEDDHDPQCLRITKSIFALIFMDISFCMLRSVVMSEEGITSTGYVFACKNGISGMINLFLLLRACCRDCDCDCDCD